MIGRSFRPNVENVRLERQELVHRSHVCLEENIRVRHAHGLTLRNH